MCAIAIFLLQVFSCIQYDVTLAEFLSGYSKLLKTIFCLKFLSSKQSLIVHTVVAPLWPLVNIFQPTCFRGHFPHKLWNLGKKNQELPLSWNSSQLSTWAHKYNCNGTEFLLSCCIPYLSLYGFSMSFYPDFSLILSKFYPDEIRIKFRYSEFLKKCIKLW